MSEQDTIPKELDKEELQAATRFQPIEEIDDLPIITLPKVVLFPGNTIPLASLDGLSPAEIRAAEKGSLRLGIVAQMNDLETSEGATHIAAFGTEAIVSGIIKLNGGKIGAVVKGMRRFFIRDLLKNDYGYVGKVTIISDEDDKDSEIKVLATTRALKALIRKILKLNPSIGQESITLLYSTDDPRLLCDLIVQNLSLTAEEKLAIFGTFNLLERMELVLKSLSREIDLLKLSNKIQEEVKYDLQESMRRSFLKEQIVAIKRELGEADFEPDEWQILKEELDAKRLPQQIGKAVEREMNKLKMMHPSSPEYALVWNYLTWLRDLPWQNEKDDEKENFSASIDLQVAKKILDRDHYGLEKIKERIIEHLAILKHRKKNKGDILLLDGPPGVGKTSLVKSIAEAMKRPFVRISLGGVKDEAEIRGHRRTYIGAMPGKIIQAMKTAKSCKCVILLDEIDKAGKSGHSDISSALLEVLDPEQNRYFTDHFLNLPYDLSSVMFVATSNNYREIPPALLDRMEPIHMSGYTDREKIEIARSYIIPATRKELNLKADQFKLSDRAIKLVINYFTREPGVRALKRELTKIGRKVVKEIVTHGKPLSERINDQNLINYLGIPRYFSEAKDRKLSPGVAIGLAYTTVGGDILYIESRMSKTANQSNGGLLLTGSLGKVMQESAQTVMSYLRSSSAQFGIKQETLNSGQIHLHLPDGATPKDGPSAGIAIMCCLVSLLKNKPLKSSLAMTGEITLRGQVLPVGGIKEKLLAAHRYQKKQIIIPAANWLDLEEIDQDVLDSFQIFPVKKMEDVLFIAGLLEKPLSNNAPIKPVPYKRLNKNMPKSLSKLQSDYISFLGK